MSKLVGRFTSLSLWRWINGLLSQRVSRRSAKLTREIEASDFTPQHLVSDYKIDVEVLRLNSKVDQALTYRSSSSEKSDRAMISR